ncbi:MAG: pantoate--beta-alanine ligase [Desulfuromonadales bacterium]|nr:pantoate--beta-alanine ligase [Desulfuromonadales bacterium]
MEIISDISEVQNLCLAARSAGKTIAFVPTMGFLHDGHLSLLQEARKRGDLLVLSIFVNPTQFGQGEDLDRYPRDFERDESLARACGVDLIFYPEAESIYPAGYATYVSVEGPLTTTLEGAYRPTHFRGVTTVVTKLFNIIQPHVALFGRKDFQQLAVIRRMTTDLNMPVKIVGMPIVREADGLAMSSRNVYLSPGERQQAPVLSQALARGRQLVADGVRVAAEVLTVLHAMIDAQQDAHIDYLLICHQATLHKQERIDADSVLLLAVSIGKTRLIDNGSLLNPQDF